MKKILVIKGSAREGGATNSLLKKALNEVEDAEIIWFDAYKEEIKHCLNCGFCKENDACVFNDLEKFFSDFEDADVIIFSSPVFNGGFSSPVKALIDRLQIYFNLFYKSGKVQPIKKHRKALLLGASGREAKGDFAFMEASLKRAFTILNIELSGKMLLEKTDEAVDFSLQEKEFSSLLKRSLDNG